MERTRQLIAARWAAFWTPIVGSHFPVFPDNHAAPLPDKAPYGRLTIIEGETDPASIGTKHTRCMGQMVVQIFLPQETGTAHATKAAAAIANEFDHLELLADDAGTKTHIVFLTTSLTPAGARNGYLQHNVWTKFRRDTIKP